MLKFALSTLCLLAACPRTGPNVPSPAKDSCRSSDSPATCVRPVIFEIGGPQGPYLEGSDIERLHFTALDPQARGVFPPPPGTRLVSAVECGEQQRPTVVVTACRTIPEVKGQGIFSCQVDVQGSEGICRNLQNPLHPDRDPTHHRGVTMVRGFWDATGAWKDDPKVVTLSCDAQGNAAANAQFELADGTITKCAREWRLDPEAVHDGFLACIRMARADYCGDGFPHTFPETDVHVLTPRDPPTALDGFCHDRYCLEASWSKDGAVCISRPRWDGAGMGIERCANLFTRVGDQYCRGNPNDGRVFSRSQRYVCGQRDPIACGPLTDPMCTGLDPGLDPGRAAP